MSEAQRPPSVLPAPAWWALQQLDPEAELEAATLAACLALAEQRFQVLYGHVLGEFAQLTPGDLGAQADALADAHHALTLLQESLHTSSRRMLDVLDRVSRELGE